MAGPRAFTIAHLSDLHLTAEDGAARSEPRLFGRLRGMNARWRALVASGVLLEADAILVTGDVTDRGEPEAWEAFWRPLREADLVARTHVIPGNHDLCHLGVRLAGYRVDVQRAMAGLAAGGQPTRFPWAVHYPAAGVAVVGLNSANIGNSSGASNAIGSLSFFQLERLARRLRSLRSVPVIVVALHHSPNIPEPATSAERSLARLSPLERWGMELPRAERRALRLLCIQAGVRLIVHGHLHRFEDRRVNALRIVGAPASTEPIGGDGSPRLEYLRYEIGGSGRVKVVRRNVDVTG